MSSATTSVRSTAGFPSKDEDDEEMVLSRRISASANRRNSTPTDVHQHASATNTSTNTPNTVTTIPTPISDSHCKNEEKDVEMAEAQEVEEHLALDADMPAFSEPRRVSSAIPMPSIVLDGRHPVPPEPMPQPKTPRTFLPTFRRSFNTDSAYVVLGWSPTWPVTVESLARSWRFIVHYHSLVAVLRATREHVDTSEGGFAPIPSFHRLVEELFAPFDPTLHTWSVYEKIISELIIGWSPRLAPMIIDGDLPGAICGMLRTRVLPTRGRLAQLEPSTRISILYRVSGYRQRDLDRKDRERFAAYLTGSLRPKGYDSWLNSFWLLDGVYLVRRRADGMPNHVSKLVNGRGPYARAAVSTPAKPEITMIGGPDDGVGPWPASDLLHFDAIAESKRSHRLLADETVDLICADEISWYGTIAALSKHPQPTPKDVALMWSLFDSLFTAIDLLRRLNAASVRPIFSMPSYRSFIKANRRGSIDTSTERTNSQSVNQLTTETPHRQTSTEELRVEEFAPTVDGAQSDARSIADDLTLVLAYSSEYVTATLAPERISSPVPDMLMGDSDTGKNMSNDLSRSLLSSEGATPAHSDTYIIQQSEVLGSSAAENSSNWTGHCKANAHANVAKLQSEYYAANPAELDMENCWLLAEVCRPRCADKVNSLVEMLAASLASINLLNTGHHFVNPADVTPPSKLLHDDDAALPQKSSGRESWEISGRWSKKPGRRSDKILDLYRRRAILHVYPAPPRAKDELMLVSPRMPLRRHREIRRGVEYPNGRPARIALVLKKFHAVATASQLKEWYRRRNPPEELLDSPTELPNRQGSTSTARRRPETRLMSHLVAETLEPLEMGNSDGEWSSKRPKIVARKTSSRPRKPPQKMMEYTEEVNYEDVIEEDDGEEMAHGLRRKRLRPGQFLAMVNGDDGEKRTPNRRPYRRPTT